MCKGCGRSFKGARGLAAHLAQAPFCRQRPRKFSTNYMDPAFDDLGSIIKRARRDLAGVDCDTLVGTGFSGGVVIPSLAMALGKSFVLIRKETDDSHHGKGRLCGTLGQRWVFVDDFISTGRTRDRVLAKIAEACEHRDYPLYQRGEHATTYVGAYLYLRSDLATRNSDTVQPGFESA